MELGEIASLFAVLLTLAQNAALLLVGVAAHGYFRGQLTATRAAWLFDGAAFALLACVGMAAPVTPLPGFHFDARNAMVAVAVLFYGPVPGLMAMGAAGFYRVVLGGGGLLGGLLSLLTTFVLAWILSARRKEPVALPHLVVAGIVIGVADLDAFLLMPADLGLQLLRTVGVPYLLANGLGVIFFGVAIMIARNSRVLLHSLRASEAAARLGEVRLRAVLDNLPNSFSLRDRDHRFLLVNPQFERWFGVKSADVVGKTFKETMLQIGRPDLVEENVNEIESVIAQGRVVVARHRNRPPLSETRRHTLITRFPVFDERGQLDTIGSIVTDITELKQAEALIEEKRESLVRHQRAILQIVQSQLVRSADLGAAIRTITEKAGEAMMSARCGIWRFIPGEAVAHRLDAWDGLRGRHDGETVAKTEELAAGFLVREPITLIADVKAHPILGQSADLRAHDISALLVARIHVEGESYGAVAFSHVGQPHEWTLEEQIFARSVADLVGLIVLARRHDEVLAALDEARDGICVESADGEVIFANQAMWTITGRGEDESLDAVLGDLQSFSAVDTYAPGYAAREFQLSQPGGRTVDVAVRRAALPQGGTVTIVLDVTVRRARDQAQAEMALRLEQAARMEAVGLLAGGIAHDFNNLLGAIASFAEFLVDDLPVGTVEQSYAVRIRQACLRGKDLVGQMLAYARPEGAGRSVSELGAVLREVEELLLPSVAKATRLDFDYGSQPVWVCANGAQISQIVTNLCLNANDALGGEPGTVRAELAELAPHHAEHPARLAAGFAVGKADPAQPYARITVSDSGSGIDPEVMRRMFEPFYTTKPRGQGTGLGLAVVHGVVAALDGMCLVESTPGRGTCISIYLPLAEDRAPDAPARLAPLNGRGRERILVVDDDVDLADAMAIGLERAGYEVGVINDPVEALAVVTEDSLVWDLVITDEDMPGMKGLQLIGEIKAVRRSLPIILCTGYGEAVPEALARGVGADGYLKKPVEPNRLAAEIRAVIDRVAESSIQPA